MAARHLLLDLAGVLCRFDSTARLERLAAASRLETAEVDERLYGSGIVDRCDRGELDAAGIRDVLREQLGLDCDDVELAQLWASAFTPDDQVLAVIDSVAPGVTRALLTNNDALLRDTLPLVLPAVHARIAIPLFSATTRAPNRPRVPTPPRWRYWARRRRTCCSSTTPRPTSTAPVGWASPPSISPRPRRCTQS